MFAAMWPFDAAAERAAAAADRAAAIARVRAEADARAAAAAAAPPVQMPPPLRHPLEPSVWAQILEAMDHAGWGGCEYFGDSAVDRVNQEWLTYFRQFRD